MQVELDWDGQVWSVDTEALTMAQAFVIKDSTKDQSWPSGRPIQPWLAGVTSGDPACVRGLYWLMLQQADRPCPVGAIADDFEVLRFHTTYLTSASMAQASADQIRRMIAETERALEPLRGALALAEAKEAAELAEQEEAGPTRPAGTAPAPSPRRSSRTRQPTPAAPGG